MRRPTLTGFAHRLRIQERARGQVVPRWAPVLLIGCTVALIPWTVLLFVELPSKQVAHHWAVAWAGFDVGITVALAATALALLRQSVWTPVFASMAATILIVDAWFDVVTSAGAGQRWVALGMAALGELPLALVCLFIARNVERVMEQGRRYVIAAGYTVDGHDVVPPPSESPG